MTRTRATLVASFTAAAIASAAFVGPADAGGSISYTYVPQTQKETRMLATGLRLYSLYQSRKANGATVQQSGSGNAAGIGQNGTGNTGLIYQKGTNHSATLQQNGAYNAYGIFQFGTGGNANVVQNGAGQAGITIQGNW